MNFLTKAGMTLVMVALGILPALVLHADSLPPIGGGGAPPLDGPDAPRTSSEGPAVIEPEPVPTEPEPATTGGPDSEEPNWWERVRSDIEEDNDEDLDEDARGRDGGMGAADETPGPGCYWTSGCPVEEADPSEPAEAPYDPYDPYGTGEPTPEPTAADPADPAEDDGGLLGDLLGG